MKPVGPKTLQICHTSQNIFPLVSQTYNHEVCRSFTQIGECFVFLGIYTLTLSCIVKFCFGTTEIEVVFYGSIYSWSMIQVIGFYVTADVTQPFTLTPLNRNVIRYRPSLNKVSQRLRLKISSALFYFVRYMIYDENQFFGERLVDRKNDNTRLVV